MKKGICIVFLISVLAEIITAQNYNECKTPDSQTGVCIIVHQCEKLHSLLETQKHVTSVRTLLQKSFCGYEGKKPKVCCSVDEEVSQVGEEPTEIIDPSNPLLLSILPSNRTCGKVMINNNSDRIVGGRPSVLGAWPWMAAIGYRSGDPRSSRIHWGCGGSLITNRHVLSAAHCFVNLGSVRPAVVRLGDLDLDPNVRDGASPVDVVIDGVTTHERYLHEKKQINDIALLKLKDKVNFNDYIQPICLPSKFDKHVNYDKMPVVSGWGSTNPSQIFDQLLPPNTKLMEVELPFVNNSKCRTAYEDTPDAVIDTRVICAGFLEGKQDSCRGDSGGPLMLAKPPQYYVVGVVSYGPKECGVPDIPGVYTRVPSFVNWIFGKLLQN